MMDFGMPQLDPSMQQPMGPQIQMPQAKPSTGMFGSGKGAKIGEAISAAIGGWLMGGGNPAGANILAMLQHRQQQRREESQYQQRRQDSLADYAEKQKIEAQYGKPAQPHYFEDNSGNQWAIGPDGQPRMVHKDDLPFKLVPNGMGGVVPVDLRALMAGQGGQAAPQGVTFTPIDEGGPTPGGSGGFPRPY